MMEICAGTSAKRWAAIFGRPGEMAAHRRPGGAKKSGGSGMAAAASRRDLHMVKPGRRAWRKPWRGEGVAEHGEGESKCQ